MSRKKGIHKGCLDSSEIRRETDQNIQEGERLGELAKRYEADTLIIEEKIKKIEDANFSYADKVMMLKELKEEIIHLQEQYEKNVVEKEAILQEEIKEQIEMIQGNADEIKKMSESIQNIELAEGTKDRIEAAENIAQEKQKELELMKKEYMEKVKLQMQQAEIMKRNMQREWFSGR